MPKKGKKKAAKSFTVWRVNVGERLGNSTLAYLIISPTMGKAEKRALAVAKRDDLMTSPQVERAERLGDIKS